MTKQSKSTQAHIRYRTKGGILVPGVTTVLAQLAKPALIHWAWKLGMEGQDYRKVRDQAAGIGTVSHYMVECDIKCLKPDLSQFLNSSVDGANVSFGMYLDWKSETGIAFDHSEVQLVSERYLYGGTLDALGKMPSRKRRLVDVKTSKGIYDEYIYQLMAYWACWDENNPNDKIDEACLLVLGKEKPSCTPHMVTWDEEAFEIFLHLRDIYALQKKGDPNRDRGRSWRKLVERGEA